MARTCYLLLLLCLSSLPALATDSAGALEPWQQWVLDGHAPEVRCPYRPEGNTLQHQCIWASRLQLNVTDRQVTFALQVTTNAKVWVQLPGDQRYWPAHVALNKQALAVVPGPTSTGQAARYPGVVLSAGQHQLRGHIPLHAPLTSIRLPEHRGLVSLVHRGTADGRVDIDNNNTLWLNRQPAAAGSSADNSVSTTVFRKITDDVPMTLATRLELSVSGAARELTLGQILPPDMVLTGLQSELPARVDNNGLLNIQVRAGQWTVLTTARYQQQPSAVAFKKVGDIWPQQEFWSFAARPQLRGVKISGAVSIDPSQLNGPAAWRQLPTYRLASEQPLLLEERYRGETTPPANHLSVNKTIWMDFTGHAATVKDNLRGQMHSGWRLSASDDVALGRAAVNNQPQVITQLPDGSTGIEIRQTQITLETVSRLHDATHFSASGWRQQVASLSANLLLPPGWKIWHIAGPDTVSHSWLAAWNLWDIFICLLIVAVVSNILGYPWALLTVLLLGLTYHEAPATLYTCAALLFLLGLLRLLPAHRFRQLVLGLGYSVALLVLVALLNFSVQATRQAIYPQLEYRQAINTGYNASSNTRSGYPAASMRAKKTIAGADAVSQRLSDAAEYAEVSLPPSAPPAKPITSKDRHQADPEHIQTGPGVPTWQWHQAELRWSGPVNADEQVTLYLTGPLLTRLLRLLQVALLLAFAGRLLLLLWHLRQAPAPAPAARTTGPTQTSSAALVLLVLGATAITPPPVAAQETYPPQFLLEEYERRLLQKPACGTACYALNQAQLSARDQRIELQLTLSTLETMGVPLPRFPLSWHPDQLLVAGQPASSVFQRRGQWYLLLAPGVHEVTISGPLHSEEFTLEFERPHNVSVDAPAFEVSGLIGSRLQGNSLTLRRKPDSTQVDTLFADPIAPFIAVRRHLALDQEWVINTTVSRLAPATGPLNVKVPLLDGEKIRVAGVETENGHVVVSLGNGQQRFTWQSTIAPSPEYTLRNGSGAAIAEHWSVAASPRWRIDSSGLAVIKTDSSDGAGNRDQAQFHWRPRSGEQVTLHATQPQPVAGPTSTVEAAQWAYTPGARAATAKLTLRILSSIGRDYVIEPPTDAVLDQLIIDGEERILPSSEPVLRIPLHPGLQHVALHWRIASGIATISSTPTLALASPPSNIDIDLTLPRNRWPLLAGGPAMGPAVLLWSILIVMVCVAVLLSYLIKRHQLSIPLRIWHWILLFVGLSTVNAGGSLWVLAWFFALEAKGRYPAPVSRWRFNLTQLGLVLLTLISAAVLLAAIPQSLLSFPDMQVQGNGSHNYLYRWYQDHSDGALPTGWVLSLPIWAYRATMLLWSLWLVFALLRWIRWGWAQYATHGYWRPRPPKTTAPVHGDNDTQRATPATNTAETNKPTTGPGEHSERRERSEHNPLKNNE